MKPSTVDAYIAEQPEDRRDALRKVRRILRESLAPGFEEGILYGMPSWYVPLSRHPDTYNGQPLTVASLASQKSHMAIYLHAVYGDAALRSSFEAGWEESGKKLDMGKSCLRFRKLDDLALDVIADTLRRLSVDAFVATHEEGRASAKKKPGAAKATRTEAAARPRAGDQKSAATGTRKPRA